jgi:hypothetical protein
MIDAEPPWQEHEIHAAHKLYVFFLLASTVEDVQDILGDPEANFENLPKRIPKPYDTFRDDFLNLPAEKKAQFLKMHGISHRSLLPPPPLRQLSL